MYYSARSAIGRSEGLAGRSVSPLRLLSKELLLSEQLGNCEGWEVSLLAQLGSEQVHCSPLSPQEPVSPASLLHAISA